MKKLSLYITKEIINPMQKQLEEYYEIEVNASNKSLNLDELKEKIKDKDAIISMLSDPLTREVLSAAKKLKIIAQYAAGYDNIELEYANKRGIIVTNTPGVLSETTADLTWALILSVSRRVCEADRYVKTGLWNEGWGPKLLLGRDVYGKTIGIIGFGRIGQAVARRAFGFNMRILYYSRSRKIDLESKIKAEYADLPTLLKEADYITIHTPLTEQTYHMLGEKEFKMMKKNAYLVNTSRGKVIDEKALIKALKEGWISGAGLDVFEIEPIEEDNPLLKMDNVVLTPHIGSASVETRTRMAEVVAENLIAFAKGLNPPNRVI
ncbi:MAG: D-glycerate dehydrogenase [Candidatus Odinarchaeum yellowstonii]|uniref:D-glycerate dehydrogenase n=1 Tax=Odinarchaeota yellowstonii (strain LCB_4) TaxID=1841599 RepID=A0AAF0D1B2_ODILC|nr:MAG: D-glycerate dehydrogenase [Candidatus Odinarchaeum yellowstonii]